MSSYMDLVFVDEDRLDIISFEADEPRSYITILGAGNFGDITGRAGNSSLSSSSSFIVIIVIGVAA